MKDKLKRMLQLMENGIDDLCNLCKIQYEGKCSESRGINEYGNKVKVSGITFCSDWEEKVNNE
jgi:hypothetical protein